MLLNKKETKKFLNKSMSDGTMIIKEDRKQQIIQFERKSKNEK